MYPYGISSEGMDHITVLSMRHYPFSKPFDHKNVHIMQIIESKLFIIYFLCDRNAFSQSLYVV